MEPLDLRETISRKAIADYVGVCFDSGSKQRVNSTPANSHDAKVIVIFDIVVTAP
ncbi:MAG: hypothetical protein Q8R28_04685 [Dehalococcoidia bacterium]|nr:hypothetical protein [Dehalococcoidia bacterium]